MAVNPVGQVVSFTFGTVGNLNRNNNQVEQIIITYTAVVLNAAGNQGGTALTNSARYFWTGGAAPSGPASAAAVTVIEPGARLIKTVNPSTGDFGDPITYTLVITGGGITDAFDALLTDALPTAGGVSLIDNPTLIVADTAGAVSAAV